MAHHSRLWNRNIIDQPKLPALGEIEIFESITGQPKQLARIYVVFCIIIFLLRTICPKSSWEQRLKALIKEFPQSE